MSTTAQQEASRTNGAKSNGPVSEAGRTNSSRNATKHGLTGGPIVLPHESQERFDALRFSLARTLNVVTPAEWNLLEEIAACRWRMNRIQVMETAILNQAFERLMAESEEDADPDRVMARAFADVADNSKGFRMLDRHQRTLWRCYDRALQELRLLQELRAEKEQLQEAEQAARNEPEVPADYSSLRASAPGSRDHEFMKAAISYLDKQNSPSTAAHPTQPSKAA